MAAHGLPAYRPRPGETVEEKAARYRAEWAAAGLRWGRESSAANDNEPEKRDPWWLAW